MPETVWGHILDIAFAGILYPPTLARADGQGGCSGQGHPWVFASCHICPESSKTRFREGQLLHAGLHGSWWVGS